MQELCSFAAEHKKPLQWLDQQIEQCEQGSLRPWQLVMWGMWPLLQNLWRALSVNEQLEFKRQWFSVFMSFYAPFPLENALKIREMLHSGQLQIISVDKVEKVEIDSFEFKQNGHKGRRRQMLIKDFTLMQLPQLSYAFLKIVSTRKQIIATKILFWIALLMQLGLERKPQICH